MEQKPLITGTSDKPPLVILAGPTASGKTALSIALAKALDGEIISADSMQVYRRMDIGTAKITKQEMQGVPHHLIDVLEPTEEFNVVRFSAMAKEAVKEVVARGKLPIVVGGTGFYIRALLYDTDFTENDSDKTYRARLEELAKEHGAQYLHDMLVKIDASAAEKIHPNNVKRVIRALEFYEKSGEKISDHNEEQRKKSSPYSFAFFVLTDEREALYARIDRRVDEMLAAGLVGEVRSLLAEGCGRESVSMQGLGYKEIAAALCGECTLEEAVYCLKRDTRHFAKRQLTWFRREPDVIWLDRSALTGTKEEKDAAILKKMVAEIESRCRE